MNTGTESGTAALALRREAYIGLGLGALALASSGFVTRWLLLGRLATLVWIGVLGAIALAIAFAEAGWRAYGTSRSLEEAAGIVTRARQGAVEYIPPPGTEPRRRRRLILLLFGSVASVAAPGVNVLVRVLVVRRVDEIDLLAWTLLVLPVCLAVWLLPPRGLGFESTSTRHDTRSRGATCPRCGSPPLDVAGSPLYSENTSTPPAGSGLTDRQPVSGTRDPGRVFFSPGSP